MKTTRAAALSHQVQVAGKSTQRELDSFSRLEVFAQPHLKHREDVAAMFLQAVECIHAEEGDCHVAEFRDHTTALGMMNQPKDTYRPGPDAKHVTLQMSMP